jgi:hypothetical protein
MSNLLKDASILLTPTAYDNGRMNAIKPYKDLEGPELVTNGDFSQGTQDWTFNTNGNNQWSVPVSEKASYAGTATDFIITNNILTVGKKYRVSFNILDTNGSTIRLSVNSEAGGSFEDYNGGDGLYTTYLTAGTNYLRIGGSSSGAAFSIDNVSVVEDLSGDFQFERNSAATRVNAQGLVENVQILSPELVSNGNFSQIGTEEVLNGNFSQEGSELVTNGDFATDSDWIKGSGTTISGGQANLDGSLSGSFQDPLRQSSVFTVGKTYKVEYTISNYVSGAVTVFGNGATEVSANGTYTQYITATITTLSFQNRAVPITCSIDNVSVKEVGQNWSLDTGWSIGEDKIIATNVNSTFLDQLNILTTGKSYKITYTILDYVSGSVRFRANLVNGANNFANGTYTDYIVSAGTKFALQGLNNFNGSITNISVKEVGQDWSIGTGWSVDQANSKAVSDTTTSNLTSSTTLISGRKYKFKLDSEAISSGSYSFLIRFNSTNTDIGVINSDGSHEFTVVADSTSFRLQTLSGGSTSFSITNISVKEITDDTNIPRINYEGFSYQDTLGSEEIVNGDFSNGNANWTIENTWTIGDGVANGNGANGNTEELVQSLSFDSSKKYKISYQILNYVSGSVRYSLSGGGGYNGQNKSANGTYVDIINTGSSHNQIKFFGLNFNGSITNVSVKEYFGQEVVPGSGCGSWLLEPQSTNLITYSEDFSDSSWYKAQTTTEAVNIAMPNGVINGYKLFANTSNSSHYLEVTPFPTATAGQNFTLSLFIKSAGSGFIQVASSTGFNSRYQNFNISTGTKASGDISDSSITDFGNGWYRISVTETTTGTNARYLIMPILSDGIRNPQFTGNADEDGVYIWGAQLEQQSYATSYIPTSGAANTRLQDIATNSGNSSLINSTEGVSYFETSAFDDISSLRLITLKSADNNNRVSIGYSNATDNIRVIVRANGSNVVNQNFTASNLTDINKFAFKYKSGASSIYLNGSEVLDLSAGNFTFSQELSKLNFDGGNGTNPFYGKAKALAVYKEALTDANLRCLTYPNPVATTFDLDFDTIAEQFTFTRGSEATFVNEQGLIESTNTLTSNLVIDEESLPLTGWSRDGDVYAAVNATSNVVLNYTSGFNFSIGDLVEVSYEVFDYVSGQPRLQLSGGGQAIYTTPVSSNGVFTETLLLIGNNTAGAIIHNNTNPTLKIRNLSIKKIITATNTPRIDYSTGEKAFLLEPQSTNLIPYSEDFSDASYSKASGGLGSVPIVTSNYSTSPSGEQNADRIQFDLNGGTSGSDSSWIFTFPASDVDGVVSIYLKTNDNSTKVVYFRNTFGTIDNVTVNGNWQRYSITNPTTRGFYLGLRGSQGNSDSADLSVWGAQIEALPYATSYIPTSGASATRNQELCVDATPVINSEEGTLYAEISALANDGTNRIISLNNGTTSNLVRFFYGVESNKIIASVKSNGGTTFSYTYTLTDPTDFIKIALKYKENDFALWVNGTEVATDTSGATPASGVLDRLDFSNAGNTSIFFGNTKGLKVYPKALADVQLEDLTTITLDTIFGSTFDITFN